MDCKLYSQLHHKLYNRLWLWNELGELCKLLRWPCAGALCIYITWALLAYDTNRGRCILTAVNLFFAAQVCLILGCKLSERMTGRVVRKLNKIMFGREQPAVSGGDVNAYSGE